MQTHHNRRLFDLAQRNAQRLALDRFCQINSQTLPAFCEQRHSAIFHPDTPAQIQAAYLRNAHAHQVPSPASPTAHHKLQTTSYRKVRDWLALEVPKLRDDDYLVSLGPGNQLTFESESVWIPSLPTLCLGRADLLRSIPGLLTLELTQFAFVGKRSSATLVLESYLGNLQHEPSEDKEVYELSHSTSDA